MNNLLNIKMNFYNEPNTKKVGPRNLNKNRKTDTKKLYQLIDDLNKIKQYYKLNNNFLKKILIDVYYNDIIAKTGRIQELLKETGDCNDNIVGARFTNANPGEENHIITYYIGEIVLDNAIKKLTTAINLIDNELNGEANSDNFNSDNASINYLNYDYKKNKIRDIIIDCSVIDKFDIPNAAIPTEKEQIIVTFYKTELNLNDLIYKLNINNYNYYYQNAGENTLSVNKQTYDYLLKKVPYMISMVASDISVMMPDEFEKEKEKNLYTIPKPNNEPIIGVIDTLFYEEAYFSEWVEYHEVLNENEKIWIKDKNDYVSHGTAVSSIICDGPSLNPLLDDGCGRFRVRHFGVCPGRINPTSLINKIKKIVTENKDIHVWNLSLGTTEEVSKNFISFDGAELDSIQEQYNVIFIVAGTNNDEDFEKRVGSPADSLNSIVVNSVKLDGSPVSYYRNGKILSFFNKPDVSYYGGDYDERINAYTERGIEKMYGTSFAAPWIARKMAYLIEIAGLSREVAKALIIDSAAGWEYKQGNYKNKNIIGYGVVPKKIQSILQCDNNEIKFILYGMTKNYCTSNYAIPVPKDDDEKTSYIARATLCYFPECNRLQGVDYTQRELTLKFGHIKKLKINDINFNTQDDDLFYNDERKARDEFRKWENTKFISSLLRERKLIPKKTDKDGLWGIQIISKERRKIAKKDSINFGIVVTLRNIKGQNRINEFKHSCLLRGYIVNEVNIKNSIDIFEKAQEQINFE